MFSLTYTFTFTLRQKHKGARQNFEDLTVGVLDVFLLLSCFFMLLRWKSEGKSKSKSEGKGKSKGKSKR